MGNGEVNQDVLNKVKVLVENNLKDIQADLERVVANLAKYCRKKFLRF